MLIFMWYLLLIAEAAEHPTFQGYDLTEWNVVLSNIPAMRYLVVCAASNRWTLIVALLP